MSVALPVPEVVNSLETMIEAVTERLEEVEKQIKALIKQENEWAKSISLLQSITGVGYLTACWLVALSLNFTTCENAESLTHYAGLAPVERRSGTSVRGRPMIGHGGHTQLRAMLYMAAGSAIRFNPVIKEYYTRLREKGKSYKEARCAAARKLVHLAFAVATKKKAFDPEYRVTIREQVPESETALTG